MNNEKITITLTAEELYNIKYILDLGFKQINNESIIVDGWPEELKSKPKGVVPETIDVNYLIKLGSVIDSNTWNYRQEHLIFDKLAKAHPDIFKDYIKQMFLSANKRGFFISGDFRKYIVDVGIKNDCIPDNATEYYAKSYAQTGSNGGWIQTKIKSGNISDKIWDILTSSKRGEVLEYVIRNCPDNVLPVVAASIGIATSYRHRYSQRESCSEYLEYLFDERTKYIRGETESFNPMYIYSWEYSKNK